MYERANYFRNKFFRNGIALLLLTVLAWGRSYSTGQPVGPGLYFFPVASAIWLSLTFFINKNLKNKIPEPPSIPEGRFNYKANESVLTMSLLLAVIFTLNGWKYALLALVTMIVIYAAWLFFEMRKLNEYFDSH